MLLGHLWLSTIRQPLPAASGNKIHQIGEWKSGQNTIRVSTYNIHRARGLDDKTDINRTAALLANDDIAGLQEVLSKSWLGEPDQAEQIAQLNGSGWLFAPIQTRYYKPYIGNALLSRFEVNQWLRQPLIWSDQLGIEDRSRGFRNIITASIRLDDQPIRLIVTHIDRGPISESQVKQVLDIFDQHERAILMADLNTHSQSPVMLNWLKDNPGGDAVGIALGDQDLGYRIDWILTRGFNIVTGGLTTEGISDHPYYWVELKLSE